MVPVTAAVGTADRAAGWADDLAAALAFDSASAEAVVQEPAAVMAAAVQVAATAVQVAVAVVLAGAAGAATVMALGSPAVAQDLESVAGC